MTQGVNADKLLRGYELYRSEVNPGRRSMTGGGSFIYNRKIIPQRRTIKSSYPNPTGDQRKGCKIFQLDCYYSCNNTILRTATPAKSEEYR